MITISIQIDANKLRQKLNRPDITQGEIARIFTTVCNEIINEHILWLSHEMQELQTNPRTYGRSS